MAICKKVTTAMIDTNEFAIALETGTPEPGPDRGAESQRPPWGQTTAPKAHTSSHDSSSWRWPTLIAGPAVSRRASESALAARDSETVPPVLQARPGSDPA